MTFNEKYKNAHRKRFDITLEVIKKFSPPPLKIFDIGPKNPFGEILKKNGYEVTNTPDNIDLDYNFTSWKNEDYDIVTAFEIFEHMVNPFGILCSVNAKKLITTVPLKLWFKSAYWNEEDPYDRHYHEFEPKQFDMLLEKSGWEIQYSKKWTAPVYKIGIRPLLRMFTSRYYLVVANRTKSIDLCSGESISLE